MGILEVRYAELWTRSLHMIIFTLIKTAVSEAMLSIVFLGIRVVTTKGSHSLLELY